MTQWPDPNKPGYPADPDKCGPFWLLWSDGQTTSLLWDSFDKVWITVVAGKKKPQEVVNFIASSGKTATLINLAEAFTAGARAAREMDVEWIKKNADFPHRTESSYKDGRLTVDHSSVSNRIQSLPLPEPAGSKPDQNVDLLGFEALGGQWANKRPNDRGGEYAAGYAHAHNKCAEELRAEIAKLKGK